MKKGLLIWILMVSAILCHAQQHKALLVGVADYPDNSGWRKIHADNDVRLLESLLSDKYETKILVNEEATFPSIQQELSLLEQRTGSGDTVIISFSCHGQQMLAVGAEEPDSLDEALIPYDAKCSYSKSYKGENHLRDNELSERVTEIRKKAGPEGFVLVLLDACHSGDTYRKAKDSANKAKDSDFIRGTYSVFGPGNRASVRVGNNLRDVVRVDKSPDYADVLYIAACQSHQLNAEMKEATQHKWYGSLSYAFFEAYQINGLADVTQLCNDIKTNVLKYNKATNQCPEFASSIEFLDTGSSERYLETEVTSGDNGSNGNLFELCFLGFLAIVTFVILCKWKKK